MGHAGRMADQAFHAAQAFSQVKELGAGDKFGGCGFRILLQAKRYNTAKVFLLFFSYTMVRMAGQSGVEYPIHQRMFFQVLCYDCRISAMLAYPQVAA